MSFFLLILYHFELLISLISDALLTKKIQFCRALPLLSTIQASLAKLSLFKSLIRSARTAFIIFFTPL